MPILHLAFETSCDDTSVAVFSDNILLSLVTKNQLIEHQSTGGVVPEVAARLHSEAIFGALDEALDIAGIKLSDCSFISCTKEPGLLPSLLIGRTVAQTLASCLSIPLYWIDHIQAHMFANFLGRKLDDIKFPAVCLTVSGGHNEIYYWKSLFEKERIGATQDDAAGEAFDKVSKMIGGPFPGGHYVATQAAQFIGEIPRNFLPFPDLGSKSLDFSFSGLKSAVKRKIDSFSKDSEGLSQERKQLLCAAFQETVIEILARKLLLAAQIKGVDTIVLSGGVSANDSLRERISLFAASQGKIFISPLEKRFSMDNAAMVGILAWYLSQA